MLDFKSLNLSLALNGKDGGYETDASAPYMDVAFPIQRGDNRYIVYIYDDRTSISELNGALLDLIVKSLFFGLVISVLLSFLMSKTMVIPIERLTEGAERVAEGDFSHKLEVASRDEIGVLTGTFNAMAQQLQETLDRGGERAQQAGHALPLYDRRRSGLFSRRCRHPCQSRR